MTDQRDRHGRFTKGNRGGPGRPRRAIERQYLTALSDAVPLETWMIIVQRAVEDAKRGDARARDWLSRYCLGINPMTLTELVADEETRHTVDDEVQETGARREASRRVGRILANMRPRAFSEPYEDVLDDPEEGELDEME